MYMSVFQTLVGNSNKLLFVHSFIRYAKVLWGGLIIGLKTSAYCLDDVSLFFNWVRIFLDIDNPSSTNNLCIKLIHYNLSYH